MKLLFQILLLSIFIPGILFSNDKIVKFEQISIEQGLSQSVVICVMQDSYGYLWFGTQDGLNQYDGYKFRRFKTDPTDSLSISGNWIYSIDEDLDGNIWVGTRSGLNKYERSKGTFVRYIHDPSNENSISDNYIHGVLVDSKNNIWVKASDLLNKYNLKNKVFEKFPYYVDPLNSYSRNRSFPIIEDADGNIWFGTPDGLNCLDPESSTIHRVVKNKNDKNSLSNNFITALTFLNKTHLIIGTSNGLNIYDIRNKSFNDLLVKHNLTLSDNSITSIFVDHNNDVWIGTDEGLNHWNTKQNSVIHYEYDIDFPDGLSNNIVLSICEDLSKNLWIGTEGAGINKSNLKPKKFKLIKKSYSNSSVNLSNNQISSILIDDFNQLWIGTYGYGLNIIDRNSNKTSHYNNNSFPNNLVDNWVHSLFRDSKGNIWIGTRQGINIYNQSSKKFYKLEEYFPFTSELEFENNRIYMIIEDSKRNIWVSTDLGLYRINWFTEEVRIFNFSSSLDGTSNNTNKVFSLLEDSEGFIWIGTLNGLNKYNPASNRYYTYKNKVNANNTISHNTVYSLCEDSEGFLWIGTLSGLNRFNKSTNEFIYISEKDGLPNNLIYSIQEDNIGNIWVSTDRGLARINKKNLDIRSFDIEDGLQGYEFNFATSYKSKNGELFFGGQEGLNSFYPDSILQDDFHAPMAINGLEVFNTQNPRYITITDSVEIVLSHKDYLFNIEFASLDFTNSSRNEYQYKMVGLEDEWINVGVRNFITFSNLPAGEYLFMVKGTNSDGIWTDNYSSLPITIKPPIWKTQLAIALYIVIIILLIYSYIEFSTKSLKLSNQILREKQLAALEIARQKEMLSIKNKNITDSINYANRIQQALFPSQSKFKEVLKDSFILHMPKDIVSGDFYWIAENEDKIFVAAVDCTGHGVPGALMSIIGLDLIRNITLNLGNDKPSDILNLMNIGINEALGSNGHEVAINDGMDIGLCVIDREKKEMEFSGAINSLYIVRDDKITEIRGNRFSVGVKEKDRSDIFTNHIIEFKKGDKYYLYTDGYADQFGGEDQKKMKYRRFRYNILRFSNLPFEEQEIKHSEQFAKWKGTLEQVDDVLLIGFSL